MQLRAALRHFKSYDLSDLNDAMNRSSIHEHIPESVRYLVRTGIIFKNTSRKRSSTLLARPSTLANFSSFFFGLWHHQMTSQFNQIIIKLWKMSLTRSWIYAAREFDQGLIIIWLLGGSRFTLSRNPYYPFPNSISNPSESNITF